MDDNHADRPDDAEISLLQAETARLYLYGADTARPDLTDAAAEAARISTRLRHGEILAELADPANDNRRTFAPIAKAHGLDTAAGIRDLIRLSCAETATAALRFVQAHDDPSTGERAHAGAVVDEILIRQWWLDTGQPGPAGGDHRRSP